MSFVFGVILGIVTGLGVALLITSCLIKDSNDIGDSVGRLENFGRLTIIHEKMRLSSKGVTKDAASSMSYALLNRSYEAARQREGLAEKVQQEAAQHAGLSSPMGMNPGVGINTAAGMSGAPGMRRPFGTQAPAGMVAAAGVNAPAKAEETAQQKATEDKDYIDMSEVAALLGRDFDSDQKT